MGRAELLERARNTVLPVLQGLGYDLVEIALAASHGRKILRIFIDQKRGVNLEDCARASKAVGAELDRCDFMSGRYHLEVSSPGAERRLRSEDDFARFVGRKARVRFKGTGGKIEEAVGLIESFSDGLVCVSSDQGDSVRVRLADIVRANLSI
ncbi:MAG: ribosome maturation factor RimP [bacterium]